MNLFLIGTKNYSNNILNDTFSVHDEALFNEWTDGNYTTHRDYLRNKASGTFTMRFRKLSEYEEFVNRLGNKRTSGGYYVCTVHCNNTNTTKTCNLFIKTTAVLHQKENLVFDYGEVAVEVEEA